MTFYLRSAVLIDTSATTLILLSKPYDGTTARVQLSLGVVPWSAARPPQ